MSLPHVIDRATYQESYKAFSKTADRALASGWAMSYGSQLMSSDAVRASSHTSLGLTPVNQDCEF